jgi:hypothetical protein
MAPGGVVFTGDGDGGAMALGQPFQFGLQRLHYLGKGLFAAAKLDVEAAIAVELTSGGVVMSVKWQLPTSDTKGEVAICQWFDKQGDLHEGEFSPGQLRSVKCFDPPC